MTTARVGVLVISLVAFVVLPAWAMRDDDIRVVKLKVGPFPIEPNRDREICQAIPIPGIGGLEIVSAAARSRISRKRQVASHHLVVYGYNGPNGDAFPEEILDEPGCAGVGPPDFYRNRSFLAGSGGESLQGRWSVTNISYPGDLTQAVPRVTGTDDAVLLVNSHYFNVSKKRAKGLVKIKLEVRPLTPGKRLVRQVTHLDASRDIFVPPGEQGGVASSLQADGAYNPFTEGNVNPPDDVCVFTLATHMHKRGTLFWIDWEQGGERTNLIAWPDYIHPGLVFRPGPLRGLLRTFDAANDFPRIHYGCEFANGVDGKEPKFGCEETPGEAPGMSWAEAEPLGIDATQSHAEPCGLDGVNCDGNPCVPANLVFGPLSDDDMCVLTAVVYDPLPGVPPEQACDLISTF
jgi:hypothetical protein